MSFDWRVNSSSISVFYMQVWNHLIKYDPSTSIISSNISINQMKPSFFYPVLYVYNRYYYHCPTIGVLFGLGMGSKNVKKSKLNKFVEYESHLYILVLWSNKIRVE